MQLNCLPIWVNEISFNNAVYKSCKKVCFFSKPKLSQKDFNTTTSNCPHSYSLRGHEMASCVSYKNGSQRWVIIFASHKWQNKRFLCCLKTKVTKRTKIWLKNGLEPFAIAACKLYFCTMSFKWRWDPSSIKVPSRVLFRGNVRAIQRN